MLKVDVNTIEKKTRKAVEDPNVTNVDLEDDLAEVCAIASNVRNALKAIEEWKDSVIAAIVAERDSYSDTAIDDDDSVASDATSIDDNERECPSLIPSVAPTPPDVPL
uniref:Polyprotein protein n=1 Tax=Steinernema glaseri TaxID=37863 RepID=A0A1I7Y9K8_9BILA